MLSINTRSGAFDSVDSIVHYLREPSPSEVVPSGTPSSMIRSRPNETDVKPTKKPKKEKALAAATAHASTSSPNTKENVQVLGSGRVRYGPITVNPRKQPSKTLFTGRRSKYEVLENDDEEKRRQRRERNRIAATKCREKRENILFDLESQYEHELQHHARLVQTIDELQERKHRLQSMLSSQPLPAYMHPPPSQQPTLVFGDAGFLPSSMDTYIPPLPPSLLEPLSNAQEPLAHALPPPPVLTNSAFAAVADDVDPFLLLEQQSQQQTMSMTSSSLERLINSLQSPPPFIENIHQHSTGLYNSAYGTSTCAQQHSGSSEDDSLPATRNNHFVY